MAFSRDDSECDDFSFVEFKADLKDPASQALNLCSHSIGQQTQQSTDREETCNAEIISESCTSLMKHEITAQMDIKLQQTEICIDVSGCSVAQFGSDIKALEVLRCKCCSKNCHSSSDEESMAVALNNLQIQSQTSPRLLSQASLKKWLNLSLLK